ncbi:MAG: imidazole glycerol phosphate synthase subunit HisH, partial [Rhodocyclaceae bacterium]|nr:imidazole glycerol phosphate synthase subunit HisH [Rhodocyclaceae bacterium]
MGNLHSVNKALERVAPAGCRVRVTSQPEEVAAAGRV